MCILNFLSFSGKQLSSLPPAASVPLVYILYIYNRTLILCPQLLVCLWEAAALLGRIRGFGFEHSIGFEACIYATTRSQFFGAQNLISHNKARLYGKRPGGPLAANQPNTQTQPPLILNISLMEFSF